MRILGTKRTSAPPAPLYATSVDFCRIFEDDMDRLYRLSLLLTADSGMAEKCFVRGLEDAKTGNPVFKEWAESWARRTIILDAIRMMGPRPDKVSTRAAAHVHPLPAELATVLGLETFERFVYVMSVLEGYRDSDCKLLLECSISDVVQARSRALEHLGIPADAVGTRQKTMETTSKADTRRTALAASLRSPLPASV